MKWITHEIVTGAVVHALTGDPLAALWSMAGAVFPDKAEGSPQKRGWANWRSSHRGWSHWPLLYIALIGLLLKSEMYFPLAADKLDDLSRIGIFLCLGALLHIFEDALCGKVPHLTPQKKAGLRLFKVGSFREYICGIIIVIAVYLMRMLYDCLK